MVAVAPKDSLVLLTGASGFIAVHILVQLLERGYTVRGTVRSADKGEYLVDLLKKKGLPADKFSYVLVEDIETEGVFDEAVKGVDGILHTASPFHFRVTDPWLDLINPAVQGTSNILRSALREPSIKRVVVTSSFASVVNAYPPVYDFTEKDWNTWSPAELEKHGKDVAPFHAYRASKVEAEKAAWKFIEENKAAFDLATICPPLVFGPVLHQIPKAESLNTSVGAWYAYLQGTKTAEDAAAGNGSLVDVRDVAQLHIEALATPEAGGSRFLVATKTLQYQELLNAVHDPKNADLLEAFPKTTVGNKDYEVLAQNTINTSHAQKTFNWKPVPYEKTVRDMTLSLAERQKEW